MTDSRRFERNLGFLSEAEQETLHNSSVAIAGAGGDGGMLAVQLARMGIGELRLADPDPFEIENTNRQAVCLTRAFGQNKAEIVAEYISEINPDAKLIVEPDGITPENTADFIKGASLVVDETEFTMHDLGIRLAREARSNNQSVMTVLNIGFGAMITTFKPQGSTLEKMLGFKTNDSIEAIADQQVSMSRWLPFLPPYIDLDVFAKVAAGEKSAPSIAPGVAMAASIGATQAFLNLTQGQNHRKAPVAAPRALVVDSMSCDLKRVRMNRRTHYRHLAGLFARNSIGLNPKASY